MASPLHAPPHPPHTPPAQSASPLPVHESQQSQEHRDTRQTSRDATSSSPSASMSTGASASASSPRSAMEGIVEENAQAGEAEGDVEKLLKKVELEKKIHQLQRRLELASVKANNGWTDMSIKDIEHKQLPATPSRRKAPLSVHTSSPMGNSQVTASPAIPYEPPSPSRPWQLIDVLWQPLPPPSHGNYPPSPSSPMKRSREDDHPEAPRPSGHGFTYPMSLASPGAKRVNGHRRASSSLSGHTLDRRMMAGPSSPLRTKFEGHEKKRRSHSHSTHDRSRREGTTSQDVDAAKALTFMLGSGSEDGGGSMSRQSSSEAILPVPDSFASPIPTSPSANPRRLGMQSNQTTPRAGDLRTPSSHARSRVPPGSGSSAERDRPEEDKTAAELMMFLAHSPSPMKSAKRGGPPDSPNRPSLGAAARVLFADEDRSKQTPSSSSSTSALPSASSSFSAGSSLPSSIGHKKTHSRGGSYSQSNLALAPPITPDSTDGSTLVQI
ncbi:hypothetical protein I350_02851 [Cryptococcus amylolentus CBS 6273]|nr:hypothetical protein I350_02851 [Cryptococcus amylolentus CBS 6273]